MKKVLPNNQTSALRSERPQDPKTFRLQLSDTQDMRTPSRCTANRSGFTLIELLVVVAIIAILTAIGVTVFTNVQKGARDARRTGDIDAIASALEAKYTPGSGTYSSLTGADFSSGKVPTDPLGTTTYKYTISTTPGGNASDIGIGPVSADGAKFFIVCAQVEDLGKGNSGDNNNMTTIAPRDTTVYYCRRSQQG